MTDTLPNIQDRRITDLLLIHAKNPDKLAEEITKLKPLTKVHQQSIISFFKRYTIQDPHALVAHTCSATSEDDEDSNIQLFIVSLSSGGTSDVKAVGGGFVGTLVYPSRQSVLLTFARYKEEFVKHHDENFKMELPLDKDRTRPMLMHLNGELTANIEIRTALTSESSLITNDSGGFAISGIAVDFFMCGRAGRPDVQPMSLFGLENLFTFSFSWDGRLVHQS